jgi:hypothetical protein
MYLSWVQIEKDAGELGGNEPMRAVDRGDTEGL